MTKSFKINDWEESNVNDYKILIKSSNSNNDSIISVYKLNEDGSYSSVETQINTLENGNVLLSSNMPFEGKCVIG